MENLINRHEQIMQDAKQIQLWLLEDLKKVNPTAYQEMLEEMNQDE